MEIHVRNVCQPYDDYRSNRCRSMFNATVEQGSVFERTFKLPIERQEWHIGVVVGPSGTGKTSVGRQLSPTGEVFQHGVWPAKPIIDALDPEGERYDDVTGALSAVGLPMETWLRSYDQLSNGEQFRADLALVLMAQGELVVIDEFTSVVDRKIAETVSRAFRAAWARRGQIVLLTCHHDVLRWLDPDWVLDTNTGKFAWVENIDYDELIQMGKQVAPAGDKLTELVV